MDKTYRVLLLEDNSNDAELIRRELQQMPFEFDIKTVKNRDAFQKSLTEFKPDLILSDFYLPQFDGLAALHLTRKVYPAMPFIIVTGSINEDTAVDCIKAGATDYVTKEHLGRLHPAVRGAIDKLEREQALLETRAHFRLLAEQARDLVYRYRFHPEPGFEFVSPSATDITGYTPEEHYADPELGLKLVHPEDRPLLEAARAGKVPPDKPLVLRWRRKDGRTIWTEQVNTPVFDPQGNLIALEGIARDITERQQAEIALRNSERQYRSLFENMLHGLAHCKMHYYRGRPVNFTYLSVNKAFETLTGLKNVVGKKVSEIIPGLRKSNPEIFEIYGRVARTGKAEKFETYLEMLGMWLSIAVYSTEKNTFTAVFDNITNRKQAESALRESEDRYRDLVENSQVLICTHDLQGRILSINRAVALSLGYTEQEVVGRNLSELLDPKVRKDFGQYLETIRQTGQARGLMYVLTKSGKRMIWAYNNNLRTAGVTEPVVRGIARDITERIAMEKALQESETNTRIMINASQDSILLTDRKGKVLVINEAGARRLGKTVEEIQGQVVFDYMPPEVARSRAKIGKQIIRNRKPQHFMDEREGIIFDHSIYPITNSRGRVTRVVTYSRDITRRVQNERAEQEIHEIYRKAIENAHGLPYSYDLQNRKYTYIGSGCQQLLGFPASEFTGKQLSQMIREVQINDPQAPRDPATYTEQFRAGKVSHYSVNMRLETPAGESKWIRDDSLPIFAEDGKTVIASIGILQDISESKQALADVQRHRQELRHLSSELIDSQEAERKRISQELHDELGQTLTGIRINLATLQRDLPADIQAPLLERLSDSLILVDQILDEMRELSLELHPTMLDDLGIRNTLEWYTETFARRHSLKLNLKLEGQAQRLPPNLVITLYRIVQEALTNVVKHAQAARVNILFREEQDRVELRIRDNGRGFDPAEIENRTLGERGIGLTGMKERVRNFEGQFSVASTPGKGTDVTVTIPIPRS